MALWPGLVCWNSNELLGRPEPPSVLGMGPSDFRDRKSTQAFLRDWGTARRVTVELELGGGSTRPPQQGGTAVSACPAAPLPADESLAPAGESMFPPMLRPRPPLPGGGPRTQSLPIRVPTHTSGCRDWFRNTPLTQTGQ